MATDSVRDNKPLSRFELDVEGGLAFANYRLTPSAVVITHTETPRSLRGRGIASELVDGALRLIRADGMKVIAGCGFVVDYLTSIRSLRILRGDQTHRRHSGATRSVEPGIWLGDSGDPDRHVRQAFQLAQQHVALHHRADILRRAGIDDVAGLQLEGLRQFCDLLGDAPDHLVQIGILPHHAVDGQRDRALGECPVFDTGWIGPSTAA